MRRYLVGLTVVALVAAACGGSDDAEADGASTPLPPAVFSADGGAFSITGPDTYDAVLTGTGTVMAVLTGSGSDVVTTPVPLDEFFGALAGSEAADAPLPVIVTTNGEMVRGTLSAATFDPDAATLQGLLEVELVRGAGGTGAGLPATVGDAVVHVRLTPMIARSLGSALEESQVASRGGASWLCWINNSC